MRFAHFCILAVVAGLQLGCDSGFISSSEKNRPRVVYEEVNDEGEITDKIEIPLPDAPDAPLPPEEKIGSASLNIVSGGTYGQHIGVVFIGDGYTAQETNLYNRDVDSIWKKLQTEEPFKSYSSYFTIYRVNYTAAHSGVSNTPSSGLGMHFNCGGMPRLLCVNTDRVLHYAKLAPRHDIVFALANSSSYGGAGYRNPAVSTLAARNPASLDLALHELGHSFALLGDEYETSGEDPQCGNTPNISSVSLFEMVRRKIKWYRWENLPHVGSFSGACYSQRYYRPTLNSKMRTLTQPFGEVNLEQFIIQIYNRMRTIKFASSQGLVNSHKVLEIHPMQPARIQMQINWHLDGKELTQFRGQTKVDTRRIQISKSSHRLSVTVVDPNPAVRDETFRQKNMSQTLNWQLQLQPTARLN